MSGMKVRHMDFRFSEDMDIVLVPDELEESMSSVAISLLLPYLEPYLIRTMKAAREQIADAALEVALRQFAAQEGQHHRQHRRFNEVIRRGGFPGLAIFEEELEADYRRFTERRSLRFNLAYAEGFEAFTTALARYSFELRLFDRMHGEARDLFLWHLVEELEHRTVAYDVYEHLFGGYVYRLSVGLYAQAHFLSWVSRVTAYLLRESPELVERFGGVTGRRRRIAGQLRQGARSFLPKLARTWLPGYTPHDIDFTDAMRRVAESYTARAIRLS